jgi:hypothetical protein
MAKCTQVFILRPSRQEGRPLIDFTRPENVKNDWLLAGQVLRGEAAEDAYPPLLVLVNHPEAEAYDYYPMPGTSDLMSERAVNVLEPYGLPCFKFFQVWLNGASFFLLKRRKRLDVLDRDHSVLVPFPSDPRNIMEVVTFRFRKNDIVDPLLFSIPETSHLFATQTVARAVEKAGLRGFEVLDAEQF